MKYHSKKIHRNNPKWHETEENRRQRKTREIKILVHQIYRDIINTLARPIRKNLTPLCRPRFHMLILECYPLKRLPQKTTLTPRGLCKAVGKLSENEVCAVKRPCFQFDSQYYIPVCVRLLLNTSGESLFSSTLTAFISYTRHSHEDITHPNACCGFVLHAKFPRSS